MHVILGVAGGIAAYKACGLLRHFAEQGDTVTVVPTAAALRFVGEATWAALSGRPVTSEVWEQGHEVPHVRLGQQADLVVVAPATADLLARAAHGLADDLLTNVLLTARCPVLMAPAMHTEMWTHPATQANVSLLQERGVHILAPADGRLTGSDSGPGRLPEPAQIYRACQDLLRGATTDLGGRRVVVSAGGTREPLDPVRYLGNRSSGKQGFALAATAARRGAQVRLIAAGSCLPVPAGVDLVTVETALDMAAAVRKAAADADVVVMAAAVADFRPADYQDTKVKKRHGPGHDKETPVLELVRNPDILAGLVDQRGESRHPVLVGFAAETGDSAGSVLDHARVKLRRKGVDLLVANEVGPDLVFGKDDSTVHLLRPGSEEVLTVGPASKTDVAEAIWDEISTMIRALTQGDTPADAPAGTPRRASGDTR